MTQKSTRPVIGLLINQIEGQYQSMIRRGISDFARDKNISLFIFVGRSLLSPYDAENQHNTIYSLANSGNLDGLIITTGSIGNYLTQNAISDFLKRFDPLPIVTIGSAIPGFTAIVPDNGSGISSLVHHLVQEHDYQRIAFLGGPENNPDALFRKDEFISALKAHGREIRQELFFQGDFSYTSGQLLAASFLGHRDLPFDAIMAANDDMALGFLQSMEAQGFLSPRDFAITGFDDVPDARFLSPSLTTVHQPLYEQGVLAGEKLLALIEGASVSEVSTTKGSLVIRESCGCTEETLIRSRFFPAVCENKIEQGLSLSTKNIVLSDVFQDISIPVSQRSQITDALSALFDALILDLRTFRDRPLFVMTLNEWLNISVNWDDFSETWHRLLSKFNQNLLERVSDLRSRAYLEDLFQNGFALLAKKSGHRSARELANLRGVLSTFRNFSWKLGALASFEEVLDFIHDNTALIGINLTILCLHEKGPKPYPIDEKTNFFMNMTYLDGLKNSVVFSAENVIPPDLNQPEKQQELLIMPLTGKDLSFGYICLGGEVVDPLVYDTLRDMISQALSNLDHFQKMQQTEGERQSTLEKLSASEERYKEMAKAVPMIVIETDTTLTIRYSNQAGLDILGITDDEHTSLRQFLSEEDCQLADDLIGRITKLKFLDYPGIRFIDRKTRRFIPIVQASGIFRDGDNSLIGLRWNALAPLPLITGSILPDKSFFTDMKITLREQEVIPLLLQGLRIKDIAEQLFIAESTVKGHLTQIYEKFGISSRTELTKMIQEEQIGRYGFSAYLFSLVNKLLSLDEE
ncbi:MAG TPA: substrate-binding domain-containing protein [Treponemataceae bacterium]|nr:substrate-binding domain-containing protein [Treponemataceae bacterium]